MEGSSGFAPWGGSEMVTHQALQLAVLKIAAGDSERRKRSLVHASEEAAYITLYSANSCSPPP